MEGTAKAAALGVEATSTDNNTNHQAAAALPSQLSTSSSAPRPRRTATTAVDSHRPCSARTGIVLFVQGQHIGSRQATTTSLPHPSSSTPFYLSLLNAAVIYYMGRAATCCFTSNGFLHRSKDCRHAEYISEGPCHDYYCSTVHV